MNEKERYKKDGEKIIDVTTNQKYSFDEIVKVLNDTEKFRVHHQEQRKVFENIVYDMTDVIDGFIKLEKLKREGWI